MSTLLTFNERLESPASFDVTLTLPFELRQKSRLRVTLDDGREAGLVLSRGQVLRGGDCLPRRTLLPPLLPLRSAALGHDPLPLENADHVRTLRRRCQDREAG